jgi:hypothetical protein
LWRAVVLVAPNGLTDALEFPSAFGRVGRRTESLEIRMRASGTDPSRTHSGRVPGTESGHSPDLTRTVARGCVRQVLS